MFAKSQRFYDLLYSWKDYRSEVAKLHAVVQSRKHPKARSWLDVACGTAKHLEVLSEWYEVEGLDLDAGMLAVARERLPTVTFHEGDFRTFELGRRYDVVSCLFSSIAYARDQGELDQSVACLARHLEPGGILFVEGFITPARFQDGYVQLLSVDEPDLKVSRMALGVAEGGKVQFEFHYLIGRASGIEHFVEEHHVSLFSDEEYLAAFEKAGLVAEHDPEGLEGRSLFTGAMRQ